MNNGSLGVKFGERLWRFMNQNIINEAQNRFKVRGGSSSSARFSNFHRIFALEWFTTESFILLILIAPVDINARSAWTSEFHIWLGSHASEKSAAIISLTRRSRTESLKSLIAKQAFPLLQESAKD